MFEQKQRGPQSIAGLLKTGVLKNAKNTDALFRRCVSVENNASKCVRGGIKAAAVYFTLFSSRQLRFEDI